MRATSVLFCATLLFVACSEEKPPLAEQPAAPRAALPASATASAPSSPPSAPAAVTVRGADGSDVMTVSIQGEVVDLTSARPARHKLRGEARETGKRKYTVDGVAVLFEIKPGDGKDFKLRDADGSLRWKVKVDDTKIRISDNEQNDNPFELKIREGDRVKVFGPGDRELGNVRFDRAASKISVENASGATLYTVDAAGPSGAWGVLLLESIPAVQRQILIAEILSRGR
jgi:hypothetical protein